MQIETIFPCIPKVFRLVGLKGKGISCDWKLGRWYITLPTTERSDRKSYETSIDNKIKNLQESVVHINTVLHQQDQQLLKILELVNKKTDKRDKKHNR